MAIESKTTRPKTIAEAKRRASTVEEAIVVKFSDGLYDWFPVGYPVGYYNSLGTFEKESHYRIIAEKKNGVWYTLPRQTE